MKILMATMGLDIGGAETHIVELSKQLQKQGHQVLIVSNGGVYVPEVEAAGIVHYQAPLNRRGVSEMRRARAILKDILRKEKPDIIHAHARIPAFLCGTLARGMKIPFVTSCHGVYQTSTMLKLLSDWGQRTLAVSEDIRDYLIDQYQIPRENIALTINGIDTEKFSPDQSPAAIREEFSLGDGPVICHVSRLDQETKLAAAQLIEAAPDLVKSFPGLRILIVGGGTAFEELSIRAAEVNGTLDEPCLILTGPRTDINALVAAGDLFVGVSRAALEAMAAGKPVILSGAQGHTGLFRPELLDKAMDTNFCCRTDPIATEDVLLQDVTDALTLSREERTELGKYGRAMVQEHYSVERMARDSLQMYEQVRTRKYRVVMSGYYGFSNAGDDAILESVHRGVEAASSEVELTVLSNDPALTRREYGLNAVSRFHVWEVFQALRKSDVLLSGGGSLLQDTTSTRSLLYYLSVIKGAQLLGKPVMLYANGIGPVRRESNRKLVKKAVERATVVTLRDHSSADELRAMGVQREDLRVTADPVFHLDPASEERADQLLAQAGIPAGTPFVAVSVRDWDSAPDFPQQLAKLCDHLKNVHGMEVLFLLMQPHKDLDTTQQVCLSMTGKAHLLEAGCDPREMMAVLGKARLCLAMRLHTLIFAARMAVPTLGLVYDPKVASYLEELELPSAGHVEQFDAGEAILRTDALLADYDRTLARLKEKSAQLACATTENERLLLELLQQSKR